MKFNTEHGKQQKIQQPPTGLTRYLFRLPIWLYRMHLGRLLGNRFMLINHQGRKSGLLHQAVVEVVKYERDTDVYYAVSGYGDKAQWFKNCNYSAEEGLAPEFGKIGRMSAVFETIHPKNPRKFVSSASSAFYPTRLLSRYQKFNSNTRNDHSSRAA